jgi:tRNA pseudouridine38-40 synthase
MSLRYLKLTISYDGVDYSGWQRLPDKRAIQGELQRAISELTGLFTKVNGASRTDAGVSALGQVANVAIDSPIPTRNLAKAINGRLPRDIVVTSVGEVDETFDASSSAKSKMYRYTICTGENPNILETRHCWHWAGKLDTKAMADAAAMLVGTKDFKSFAAAADERPSSMRTVTRCDVREDRDWIRIEVEADRFLYNMVRVIVGTLVEIGRGRWKPERIAEILAAKDRTAAGPTAPAQGLCLMRVDY